MIGDEEDIVPFFLKTLLFTLQFMAGVLAFCIGVCWSGTGLNPIEVLYK